MARKRPEIAPEDRLTRSNPVFWLARLGGVLAAVLVGWIANGLVVGMDETTGLGSALVAAVSVVAYAEMEIGGQNRGTPYLFRQNRGTPYLFPMPSSYFC